MDNCESDEINFIDQIIDYRLIIDFQKMTNNFVKKYLSYVTELCELNDHIGFFLRSIDYQLSIDLSFIHLVVMSNLKKSVFAFC